MFELIFALIFAATLLATGVTFLTVLAAIGFAMVVMLLLGMMSAVIKLIPWLVVIAIAVWFFKSVVAQPRS